VLQLTDLGELSGAVPAASNVRFDITCVNDIELAIGQRMNKRFLVVAAHMIFALFSSSNQAACTSSLAWASRDMTVPIGTPIVSAI
jgi:hypothetical protein